MSHSFPFFTKSVIDIFLTLSPAPFFSSSMYHFLMCHVLPSARAFAHAVFSSQNTFPAFFTFQNPPLSFKNQFKCRILSETFPYSSQSNYFFLSPYVSTAHFIPLYIISNCCTSMSHTRLEVFWWCEPCLRKFYVVPSMSICKVFGWILCIGAWKIRAFFILEKNEKCLFVLLTIA